MKTRLLAASAAAFAFGSASADLFIYEPFDYTATSGTSNAAFLGDGNQSGALGTTGAWSQLTNNATNNNRFIDVFSPGLTFTDGGANDLPVAGGFATRADRVGQNSISIAVDPIATAGLTADNSTMWMSFLFIDRGFSGPNSLIALASETMVASDSNNLTAAGNGVGVSVRANNSGSLRPVSTAVFNNAAGATRVNSNLSFPVNTGNPNSVDATAVENQVYLFAIKVNWNEDGTDDEIFLFNIEDLTTEPDELDAIASDTFDMSLVNQQSLDVLNIGNTQIDGFDEIRFASTFLEAVGVPEPSSLALLGLGGLMIARRRRG